MTNTPTNLLSEMSCREGLNTKPVCFSDKEVYREERKREREGVREREGRRGRGEGVSRIETVGVWGGERGTKSKDSGRTPAKI